MLGHVVLIISCNLLDALLNGEDRMATGEYCTGHCSTSRLVDTGNYYRPKARINKRSVYWNLLKLGGEGLSTGL